MSCKKALGQKKILPVRRKNRRKERTLPWGLSEQISNYSKYKGEQTTPRFIAPKPKFLGSIAGMGRQQAICGGRSVVWVEIEAPQEMLWPLSKDQAKSRSTASKEKGSSAARGDESKGRKRALPGREGMRGALQDSTREGPPVALRQSKEKEE